MTDEASMTLPQPNLPLLRKVLDHIDAHPEEWDQGDWVRTASDLAALGRVVPECGTAHCIAGHAVSMTEGTRILSSGAIRPASGRTWGDAAQSILGLTDDERWYLFASQNTRADVQVVAERIAARAGEVL